MSRFKGDEITFTGGKYLGMKGWLNASKDETKEQVYVIVELPSGSEKDTRVNKENIAVGQEKEPMSYEEACLQQHPQVEKDLKKLVKQLAMCGIGPHPQIAKIFMDALEKAVTAQQKKGGKAMYYHTDFKAKQLDLSGLKK